MNEYKDRKITRTSFLDDAFRKNLESALRFGNPLLVQVEFPPDLCSRVTFVNFTVTRSSLQSQCLNEVLKAERPDVDEKRSDLLKLQGKMDRN
ncbi:Cytoplasmic dynein 1 heavy chain 1 [Xenoophorus captivus]|uniref:Cytoplasmic dynein 1 heavy chain 1 n=1 Tax=Xenoophorus captivus TaxID=1517983 RepID=A0ABV0RF16_9TELE